VEKFDPDTAATEAGNHIFELSVFSFAAKDKSKNVSLF